MTDQYTPTTEQIELLVLGQLKQSAEKRGIPVDVEADRADFRRWLAERDAAVEAAAEQRGAEETLAYLIEDYPAYASHEEIRAWIQARLDHVRSADQIANKENE